MRLTCPNCKAQYEIEDSVIPEGGRDVQCSACGHTWYQYPLSVALQMRAEELDDVIDESRDEARDEARDGASGASDDREEAASAVPASSATQRRVDRSVMDLLREEAEREIRERRGADRDTGGDEEAVRPSRPSPRRQEATEAEAAREPARAASADGAGSQDEPAANASSRRNLLPDIDELSSTLEPRRDARRGATAPESEVTETRGDERRGLLRGLSVVVIIAGVLLALYLLAPVIAEQVPALADSMNGYVALVDALRAQVMGWVTQITGALPGG